MIVYKEQFGAEYTDDFNRAVKDPVKAVSVGYRLLWAMAKCADDTIPDPDVFFDGLGDDFDLLGAVDTAAELMRKSLGEFAVCDTENADTGEEAASTSVIGERKPRYGIFAI